MLPPQIGPRPNATTNSILIAKNAKVELVLLPQLANRHGLITGTTGTDKAVTLRTIVQGLSKIGVPVSLADVKGDLVGISQAGQPNDKLRVCLQERGLEGPQWVCCPVTLWDVYGEHGHPVRTTVSDTDPLMPLYMLELSDTQTGVLNLVFKIMDDSGLALFDMGNLHVVPQHVDEHSPDYMSEYGNISSASTRATQRSLTALEEQGADQLLDESILDINNLMRAAHGQGVISIPAADELSNVPELYVTLLLRSLFELFEHLSGVDDADKSKSAFLFDEAHSLFNDASPSLLQKVEQVVWLTHSKGAGMYFVTQSPADVPDTVFGQLGNRVQYAFRALTPRDQKVVKVAAIMVRVSPEFNTEEAIGELTVGEALISTLDGGGRPEITQRAFVVPSASRIGSTLDDERCELMTNPLVAGRYDTAINYESACEIPDGHAAKGGTTSASVLSSIDMDLGVSVDSAPASVLASTSQESGGWLGDVGPILTKGTGRSGRGDSTIETLAKLTMRTIGLAVGREIVHGVLGSTSGGSKRR